jgi:hypothetical protein
MPATTPEQQRLFGQAYAIKSGKMKPEDLNPEYRDEIVKLADSMTIKQLKDFAETKHSEMKKESEEINEMRKRKYTPIPEFNQFIEENSVATVGSVNGMGAPALPGNPGTQNDYVTQETGSGDIPYTLSKGQPKKKKKSSFVSFKDFIKGSDELRSAF